MDIQLVEKKKNELIKSFAIAYVNHEDIFKELSNYQLFLDRYKIQLPHISDDANKLFSLTKIKYQSDFEKLRHLTKMLRSSGK